MQIALIDLRFAIMHMEVADDDSAASQPLNTNAAYKEQSDMDHILKGKWKTYLVVDVPDLRYLFSDDELDLTNITDDGDTKDCIHKGQKLKGKVKEIGTGADKIFVFAIERVDGKRKWDAKFVRDKNNQKVMAGTVTFDSHFTLEVNRNAFTQNDGIWIATQP